MWPIGRRGDSLATGTLIGPFAQIVTMDSIPAAGPLEDGVIRIVDDGGLLLESGRVAKVLERADFLKLKRSSSKKPSLILEEDIVALPGFVDAHTHICYAGSRLEDHLMRSRGLDYAQIAERGGGIMSTVRATRKASELRLVKSLMKRADEHMRRGVTTCEVKSGYGLDAENELKMLRAVRRADRSRGPLPKLVPTFLAAHILPPEARSEEAYLTRMSNVLETVKKEALAQRVDAWIDDRAFSSGPAERFLLRAKKIGFSVTVHADQFSTGGSAVAADVGAVSADHLELTVDSDLKKLKAAGVAATVLPGSSMYLGGSFAPARRMLDVGLSLIIASDWNPGTAPSGDLLVQASALAANQHLTAAETLAGVTCRAAKVLGLPDRGIISAGSEADLVCFECSRFEEIFYRLGALRPSFVIRGGQFVSACEG